MRHENLGGTDDLTDVILVRVGPDEEGDRERHRDWNGGLQEPSGLKCSYRRFGGRVELPQVPWRSERDLNVSHVEVGAGTLCMEGKLERACSQSPVLFGFVDWVRSERARCDSCPEAGRSPCCQGHSRPPKAPRVPPRNMGTSIRAPGMRNPGKPPSPAMSRTRGGISVVVGARESRAQGEGR